MDPRRTLISRHSRGALLRASLATVVALGLMLPLAGAAFAADPSPSPAASPSLAPRTDLRIEGRALLGGHVRPGAWAAVVVHVENDGPQIAGELRIRSTQQGRSQYGRLVDLPPGARQDHTLYAQTALFGSRLNIDFVADGQTLVTRDVQVKSHDSYTPIVAIVAQRPEGIQAGVNEAIRNPNLQAPTVITLGVADLPDRVEAWSAIDRLVWQDVDAATMRDSQREALRLWLGAGGRLVILGGTLGVGPVRGFDEDLLPFQADRTVDVAPADLSALLGAPPSNATSVPAIGGTLIRGTVLARSGDVVVGGEATFGQGTVVLVGLNPAEPWIAASDAGRSLWRRLLPTGQEAILNPLIIGNDSALVGALQNLPAIDLPPIEQLFLLLFAYVALIGPINYVVLRRLDKREWAWVTMPVLVLVFAVVSYGMGAALKGSDVIVNQIAIVRAAQGTERGLGQVYIGIFSPSRQSFDVRVPGGALLSNPTSLAESGQAEQPLDVLFGDPSRLRNFDVGFGLLRGFRAEAPADAPAVESDLRISQGKLQGTITNKSDAPLQHVAITFGGGIAVMPELGAGETRSIEVDTASFTPYGTQLSERMFGSGFSRDVAQQRAIITRRAVIDTLTDYGPRVRGTPLSTPTLLAWQPRSAIDVEIGGDVPNRVGESLYIVPLQATIDAQAVYNDQLLTKTVLESTAGDWSEGNTMFLGRGMMTIEARPQVTGIFRASSLEIVLSQGEFLPMRGTGQLLEPLPDAEQPDQDDPLGPGTGGGGGGGGQEPGKREFFDRLPEFQLWDHFAGRWFEFPHLIPARAYTVSADRFVDTSGSVRARMVNRGLDQDFEEQTHFQWLLRLEGTIE
jgi:hypothetical protein